ncbi:MAG: helix-hairpin-helix domain-containing protein [Bacteroidota bacterium]|nr:helix-hairpin-helix domain-containing protein [Bacteroidota bacterium]
MAIDTTRCSEDHNSIYKITGYRFKVQQYSSSPRTISAARMLIQIASVLKLKSLPVILALALTIPAAAQTDKKNEAVEQLIEQIAENSDTELDYTKLAEDLYFFAAQPLNLNQASRADLERILFLNDFQIEELLNYRHNYGNLLTLYELGRLETFSQSDIYNLLPFVTLEGQKPEKKIKLRNALRYGRHNVFFRTQSYIQQQKGYTPPDEPGDTRYLGNSMRYYTRYQYSYKQKILLGVVGEKDPGEEFFTGSQKQGFDHYTAHLELRDIGRIKSLCIGDYSVRTGQGLIAGTGLYGGKSPNVMSIKKSNVGVKKYSSTGENQFLRGLGGTINIGNVDVTGFISYKNIDGNADQTDTLSNEIDVISSFQNTGYHRTTSELADKKVVSELLFGGSAKWHSKYFKVGANYIQYFYGADLNKNPNINEQYDFKGNHGANASIDYQANYKNLYFFGEVAGSQNKSYALLNGALMKIAPSIGFSLLHRYYAADYQAQYAGAFAEQSGIQNEKGLYLGMETFPVRKWKLSVYADIYSFPWLDYRKDAPSGGEDYFAQIGYTPNRQVSMYWRFKYETKQENSSETDFGIKPLLTTELGKARFHISYPISETVSLKNRVELTHYTKGNEKNETGFMLYQDVEWKPNIVPLVLHYRLALFDADYSARIYAYENDILYAFSIPAYSGQGLRTYLTLKYTLLEDRLDLWLRYAHTHYTDRDIISSGLNEINGTDKSQFKIQLRLKF